MPWQPKYIKRFIEFLQTSTGVARILTDAGEAYLKPLGNNAGPHALVREWIGTSVAALLGLRTFEFAIMHVVEGDDIPLGHWKKALPGPAFVTRMQEGYNWGGGERELRNARDSSTFFRMVLLDTYILNPDRYLPEDGRVRLNKDNVFIVPFKNDDSVDVVAFDHSACLRPPAEISARIANIETVRDENVYGCFPEFCAFMKSQHVVAGVALLAAIDESVVSRIVDGVPRDWLQSMAVRDALKDFLVRRAQFLADRSMWCERLGLMDLD